MSASVCLLNYNSYLDTIECLNNLLCQTMNDYSIIIVDNCSTNDSLNQISSYLSTKNIAFSFHSYENSVLTNTKSINSPTKVFLIACLQNNGFSAGNNVAIGFSNNYLKNEQILLLNNDTVIESDFLETLSNEYNRLQKKHNKPIALGCPEYNYFTRHKSHNGFHYLNLPSALSFANPIPPYYKYICGACLMVDNKAPMLNEDYFLYFDDIDYSKKLTRLGYKLASTIKTHYFHKISGHCHRVGLFGNIE